MTSNKSNKKGMKKMILTAAAIIGTSSLLFHGALQASTAAQFEKINTVPTSYTDDATVENRSQHSIPEGYKQGSYTIGEIDLEYFHNQKPTSKDMTKADAAEIGAQSLWEVFAANLDDQVIEMGYQQATESYPRSSWYGDVVVDGELSYYFSVDSVTGELLDIGRASRTLDGNISIAFDAELDKNPQEFGEVAKELAEQHNVVHGAVQSVQYNGQGYSNNDPTISFDILGENGEIALMTLSRFDQELLGIAYHTSYKATLDFNEKLVKKLQEEVEALAQSESHIDGNEAPTLKVIEIE